MVEYEKVAKALRKEYDIIVALIDGDEVSTHTLHSCLPCGP